MKIAIFVALLALVCGALAIPTEMCVNCDDVVDGVWIGGVKQTLGPNSSIWNEFDCFPVDLPEGNTVIAWKGTNTQAHEAGCVAYFNRINIDGSKSVLGVSTHSNVKVGQDIPDSAGWYMPAFDDSNWNASSNCPLSTLWNVDYSKIPGVERVWNGDCNNAVEVPLTRLFRFSVSVFGPAGPRVPCGHLYCSQQAVSNETLNPDFCMACGGNPSTGAGYCTLYTTRPEICNQFPAFCFQTPQGTCVNWGPNACHDSCKVTLAEGNCYTAGNTCSCPISTPINCGHKSCSAAAAASSNSRFASLCVGNPSTGAGYCTAYSSKPAECERFPDFCFQMSSGAWCASAIHACEDGCMQTTSTNKCPGSVLTAGVCGCQ